MVLGRLVGVYNAGQCFSLLFVQEGRPVHHRKPSVHTGSPASAVPRSLAEDFARQASSSQSQQQQQQQQQQRPGRSESPPPAAATEESEEDDCFDDPLAKKRKPVKGGKTDRGGRRNGRGGGRGGGTSGKRASGAERVKERKGPVLPCGGAMVDLEAPSKGRKTRPPTKKQKVDYNVFFCRCSMYFAFSTVLLFNLQVINSTSDKTTVVQHFVLEDNLGTGPSVVLDPADAQRKYLGTDANSQLRSWGSRYRQHSFTFVSLYYLSLLFIFLALRLFRMHKLLIATSFVGSHQ